MWGFKIKKHILALAGICCIIPLILGVYIISKNTNKDVKVNIGGAEKTINTEGKTFQQICSETSGLWMAKDMGMSELRNGVSASIEKCSGCMPDSKNMFCRLDGYIVYIKENGVKPQESNMEMEK